MSVGIVIFNARQRIAGVIDAALRAGCPPQRIGVFDVGGKDDGPDFVEANYPGVHVERSNVDLGPNPGRNRGVLWSPTPLVMLIDDDVHLEPDTVPKLRAVLAQEPDAGAAVPLVVYGTTPEVIQYAGVWRHYLGEAINPYQNRRVAERGTDRRDVPIATGSGTLVWKQAAIDAGLYDETYFLGREDGEFSHRLNLMGLRIVEEPAARVLHFVDRRGSKLFYYQVRNRWHKMLKLYQIRTLVLLLPMLLIYEVLQLSMLTVKGHFFTYLRAIAGLIRMLPTVPPGRAHAARIRRRFDYDLMTAGPMLIRDDFLTIPILHWLKNRFDELFTAYWWLLNRAPIRRLWTTGWRQRFAHTPASHPNAIARPLGPGSAI